MEFCDKVEELVKKETDLDDGGDLCWNLVEMGQIDQNEGPEAAARIVAQNLLQP